MLAARFQDAVAKRLTATDRTQQVRADRDAFIQAQFPLLDAAFSTMMDVAVGTDPRLAIVSTPAIETFTNHTFASLAKTVIEVRSTLYGPTESVRFTPALQSIYPDQFAVIRVRTDGVPDLTANPLVKAIQDRGILMRGSTSASLVIPIGDNFATLTALLLEDYLATLFIRTE
jgi:hypothetical protein